MLQAAGGTRLDAACGTWLPVLCPACFMTLRRAAPVHPWRSSGPRNVSGTCSRLVVRIAGQAGRQVADRAAVVRVRRAVVRREVCTDRSTVAPAGTAGMLRRVRALLRAAAESKKQPALRMRS